MRSSHYDPAGALLGALAFGLRFLAWAIVALVVADTFVTGQVRAALLPANTLLGRLIPEALSGVLVIATPFGGAFRGDFALVALILLLADWALCKFVSSLR